MPSQPILASIATTEALGVHQSDIIIRTAIMSAIADMRVNPWLLDYAFASLARDTLTAGTYGQQEISRAKEWFRATNIPVVFNINPNEAKFPVITLSLMNSNEVEGEGTLADTHYVPFEPNDDSWTPVTGPLTPLSYVPATGTITYTFDGNIVVAGMIVVTAQGNEYPITAVNFDGTITIATGIVDNFSGMSIYPQRPQNVTQLESSVFRETYAIGCHVDSEAVHLTYLHSIVVFALLRYKQIYLEARGFERSTLNSTDFRRDDQTQPEHVYSRYVQIVGSVRQYWPKTIAPAAVGAVIGLTATQLTDATESNVVPIPLELDTPPAGSGTGLVASNPNAFVVYYGAAAQPGSLNAAFLQSLNGATITSIHGQSVTYNAGAGQYLWYAFPTGQGSTLTDGNFIDAESHIEASFALVGTVQIAGTNYNVWRSAQTTLGNVTVLVI